MKHFKQIGLVLAFLVSWAVPAAALQVTTTSNANLRSGPSTSAQVLKVIPKATRLNIGNCTTWCAVTYGGQTGYVSKSTLSAPASPAPISAPANPGTYTNVDGQQIQRPTMSDTVPAGASAHCRDGTYSFSTHRRGTCSHHGGVDQWM